MSRVRKVNNQKLTTPGGQFTHYNQTFPLILIVWDELSDEVEEASEGAIADQVAWSIKKCAQVLESSINKLEATYKASDYKDHLVWDKDDEPAMDFVAEASRDENVSCTSSH